MGGVPSSSGGGKDWAMAMLWLFSSRSVDGLQAYMAVIDGNKYNYNNL